MIMTQNLDDNSDKSKETIFFIDQYYHYACQNGFFEVVTPIVQQNNTS
jgi:hypothetical protein